MERIPVCLVCDKILGVYNWGNKFSDAVNPVVKATVWRATGNYGSEIYDPIGHRGGDSFIEAYICDDCLKKKKKFMYKVILGEREVAEVSHPDFGE